MIYNHTCQFLIHVVTSIRNTVSKQLETFPISHKNTTGKAFSSFSISAAGITTWQTHAEYGISWFKAKHPSTGSLTFTMKSYKRRKFFLKKDKKTVRLNRHIQLSHQIIVLNDLGMHARPAAKIAQMAMNATQNIWLSDGNNQVDAASIIDILTLCAQKGARIRIQAESSQDTAILEQIKAFFDNGFGELTP